MYDNDWDSPRWTSLETVAGQGFEEMLDLHSFEKKAVKWKVCRLIYCFRLRKRVRMSLQGKADYLLQRRK